MSTTLNSQKTSSKAKKLLFLTALQQSLNLQQIERVRCSRDPKYWLWGDGVRHDGYVFTIDQHDLGNPIKRFPKKDYLNYLVDEWLQETMLFIPKSRQIMCSWLFSALYLWDAQFNKGRYIYFQSKKEEDADYLVKHRAGFILEHQPSFLWPQDFNLKRDLSYCKISFHSNKSYIQGIPEGGDQIRSKVPSGVFSDEAAFQPEFQKAWIASKPCIDGGGRFTAVSSANEGFFKEMVFD